MDIIFVLVVVKNLGNKIIKKVTVESIAGHLYQKVENVYSENDEPVDNTPSQMASIELTKLLLEVASSQNYIKHNEYVDRDKINFNDYNTTGNELTGEFIEFGDVRKSFDANYANNLFNCSCGNTRRFNILDKVKELKAIGIECDKCHAQYWFIPKYISDELEKFEKNVYNNSSLDVETKMVLEGDFIDKVQRFPVGGQYIIFEKTGDK